MEYGKTLTRTATRMKCFGCNAMAHFGVSQAKVSLWNFISMDIFKCQFVSKAERKLILKHPTSPLASPFCVPILCFSHLHNWPFQQHSHPKRKHLPSACKSPHLHFHSPLSSPIHLDSFCKSLIPLGPWVRSHLRTWDNPHSPGWDRTAPLHRVPHSNACPSGFHSFFLPDRRICSHPPPACCAHLLLRLLFVSSHLLTTTWEAI